MTMREASEDASCAEKIKAAEYVADLTGDLARIARDNKLHTLGYLLEMARLEAQTVAGRPVSSEGGGLS